MAGYAEPPRGLWSSPSTWRPRLVAVGLGLVRDPFFDPNCWANCTDNVFLLRSLPGLARGIESAHRWFTVLAAIALVIIIAWRLLTDSGPARRALLPFALPAALLAGAVIAHAVVLQRTPARGSLPARLSEHLHRRMRRSPASRRSTGLGHGPHATAAPCCRPDHGEPGPGAPAGISAAGTRSSGR